MNDAVWSADRAGEAFAALAAESGLAAPPGAGSAARLPAGDQVRDVAGDLGLEAEEVDIPYPEVAALIRGCAPALISITVPGEDPEGYLAVVGRRRGRLRLLRPDFTVATVPQGKVVDHLRRPWEARAAPGVDRIIERVAPRPGLLPGRRRRTREALLEERLEKLRLGPAWLLRLPPGSGFARQCHRAGLWWKLAEFLGAYAVSYTLLLASWWVLGQSVLTGRIDTAWLGLWVLLLASLVPPRMMSFWAQSRLTVDLGALLKKRLFQGTLRMDPDEIRHQGAGELLGRVLESEAAESNALQGGFLAAVGGIELIFSGWILSRGAGGWGHTAVLVGWALVVAVLARTYFLRRRSWTSARLSMTHELIEGLVGHPTRLAQSNPDTWHERDDAELARYLDESTRMDRVHGWLLSLTPRVWLLIGIGALMPAFVTQSGSVAGLALGLGGVLTAGRGFQKVSGGLGFLVGAVLSWRQAAPIFYAAARGDKRGDAIAQQGTHAERGSAGGGKAKGSVLLEARDLVFQHAGRPRAVIAGCDLEIRRGDRLLLEGASGGGKSTLVGLLTRLREPDSGLLLLDGLDAHTVGEAAWRRRVVAAPQFHENHVFTETFLFNLLMGRRWPPTAEDVADAEAVCRELGLGDLLDRMPSGLQQLVGETGWQLSHGERSRLFIARTLLQGAELVILDESFAALDPETFQQVLGCVLERAPTLLVVAHL